MYYTGEVGVGCVTSCDPKEISSGHKLLSNGPKWLLVGPKGLKAYQIIPECYHGIVIQAITFIVLKDDNVDC